MRATFVNLAAGALAMGACAIAGAAAAAPPVAGSIYVALGSSYAAGTSLPRQAEDSPQRCGQGMDNYPRQLARAFGLKLVDRSCGGSTTVHIVKGGQFDLPAQLDGVGPDTALVTITTGGNDVRFVADFGLLSCRNRAAADPAPAATPPQCGAVPPEFDMERAFGEVDANLRAIVAEIRRRAPKARIVFVDYATIVPPDGSCAALGLTADQAAMMRQRAARLAALTAKVATDTGADLVKTSEVTRAHHVCAAEPWAWGVVSPEERARTNAFGFHPRPEGIAATAKAVIERLQR